MRMFAVLAVVAFLANSSSTAEAQVRSQPTAPVWQALIQADIAHDRMTVQRRYVFKCSYAKNKNKFLKRKSERTLGSPQIIVNESQAGKLEIVSQRPFVTGVQRIRDLETGVHANQPLITVLEEGYKVEVEITPIDEKYVQLDARFELLQIDDVENVELDNCTTQAPVHNSITQRMVRTVQLGEKLQLVIPAFGKEKPVTLEYTINELDKAGLRQTKTQKRSAQST